MSPLLEPNNNFHKRKMLKLIQLDFLYDLNPMKMRIEDLNSVFYILIFC